MDYKRCHALLCICHYAFLALKATMACASNTSYQLKLFGLQFCDTDQHICQHKRRVFSYSMFLFCTYSEQILDSSNAANNNEEDGGAMMEVEVCRGEVDRPDSSAYANAQGVPTSLLLCRTRTAACARC